MDIYSPDNVEGIVDIAKARAALAASGAQSETGRKATVAEVTAATLLDVAVSLRVIAAEAGLAMSTATFGLEEILEDDKPDDTERDFVLVGDLVVVDGNDEPGEVRALGFSEGGAWADVLFANGAEYRAWLSTVHRLVGDERDDETMREAAEASIVALGDEAFTDEVKAAIELVTSVGYRVSGYVPPAEVILADGSAAPVGDDGIPILHNAEELARLNAEELARLNAEELARLNAAADAEGDLDDGAGGTILPLPSGEIDDDFDEAPTTALDTLKAKSGKKKGKKV